MNTITKAEAFLALGYVAVAFLVLGYENGLRKQDLQFKQHLREKYCADHPMYYSCKKEQL